MTSASAQKTNLEDLVFPITVESRFGGLVIEKKDLLTLEQNIYGFEEYSVYGLVPLPKQQKPLFHILQCFDEIGLAFLLTSLKGELKDLINLDDMRQATESLSLDFEHCDFYAITSAKQIDEKTNLSLNLKAPFIVDRINKKGWQYIMNTGDYPVQYNLKCGF